MRPSIPFNRPFLTGRELTYISEAHAESHLAGDGSFTRRCSSWLEAQLGCRSALLTHSCTGALEMAAILLDIKQGDEVIMPSYTFVSTANAFVLRGGVPVFVDVREDTLNLDESKIEQAITSRTKAIVPVHYAGVACEMAAIMEIAARHRLAVVEDAAQGILATYRGRSLGSFGALAALSFHETKNVTSGEGGALLVNDETLLERAEIIRQKGTNRNQFFRGLVDKYTWVDIGSSFLAGDLVAAFLFAQLEEAVSITRRRLAIWNRYHEAFIGLEARGVARRPIVPPDCTHNAHMYYLLLRDLQARETLIKTLRSVGIDAVFHYVPLHSSPAGRQYGRSEGNLDATQRLSERLVRLPLWLGLEDQVGYIIDAVETALR
jgi:dTDP-4-amino-4,6-dideoxygalactose transaminase